MAWQHGVLLTSDNQASNVLPYVVAKQDQQLVPRGHNHQPVTVVVPESTSPQPVINVTVHVHQAGGKLKTIIFLILIGFICWDGYFNKFAYIKSAFSVTKQVVEPYIPISSSMKGVDYRLVKIIHRAQELAPFSIDVVECIRDQSRQNKLFAQGFSWTTNSYHKTGHACDLTKQGVAQTDNKASWAAVREINKYMQQAAREQGVKLIWGGDWKTTPDGFHWQVPRDSFVKPPIQKTPKNLRPNVRYQIHVIRRTFLYM